MRELLSYSFVLPPTIFIVGCLAGALLGLVRPRIGTIVVMSSSILLYLFATPAVATFLTDELVMSVPTNPDSSVRNVARSEEHTSELQSHLNLVCLLLLEKKNTTTYTTAT